MAASIKWPDIFPRHFYVQPGGAKAHATKKKKQHAYNRINNPLHHNMRIAWVGFIDPNHKRVHFGNSRFFGENEQINTLNRRSRNSVGKNVFMLPR